MRSNGKFGIGLFKVLILENCGSGHVQVQTFDFYFHDRSFTFTSSSHWTITLPKAHSEDLLYRLIL